MTVSTYGGLVTAITEWLARDNDTTLIARIPDFITLAEAKFNRQLRLNLLEKRATATVNTSSTEPEFISLPSDFQTMRRVRLTGITGKPRLQFRSTTQADEYRFGIGNVSGEPKYFTIIGDEMELIPTPDSAYALEMTYRAKVASITSSNTTSALLTLAPDLYLYGALMESAPYIQQDDRIAVWSAGMSSAIAGLNQLSQDQSYGTGPLEIRTSGFTP